eukprot:TRINITY_DN16484_c0_g1_i2.p1 TRINITY_DN16484_c0_g1~~TRINITY_DN16484_c0_g1_i2.p1  ORF type:complete len:351 (-),score=19.46 TRINITY_DN16484_c0_g1_i2:65-1117(-)
MGNSQAQTPQSRYYSTLNSDLYSTASHANWNILSVEVNKEKKKPIHKLKEDSVMDSLEVIAMRNHALHYREERVSCKYFESPKKREEDSKTLSTTRTSHKTPFTTQRKSNQVDAFDPSETPIEEFEEFEELKVHRSKSPSIQVKAPRSRNPLSSTITSFSSSAHHKIITQTVDSPKTKLYYGFVYRYYLGVTPKSVKRIAEAGANCFRYFKTNYSYWLTFPLTSIKYKEISEVKCLKNEDLSTAQYLFEIYFKNDPIGSKALEIGKETNELSECKAYIVDGISFRSKLQASSYIDYITKHNKEIGRRHKLDLKKMAKVQIKTGGRIILGVDTQKECEKWVGLLSWLASLS